MDALKILPRELKKKIDAQEDFFLLDVRNKTEYALAHLKNATLIPLPELEKKTDELPRQKEIIVYCHHGVRSLEAAQLLKEKGFTVKSLAGGIDVWSKFIDPTIPQY